MTPGVAGPGAFTQAQQQLTSDMGGLGDIHEMPQDKFQDLPEAQGLLPSNRIYKVFKIKSLLDPTGYQAYMSPYQQDVIDTTLAEFDKQAADWKIGLGKSASQAGAFGGARHGIAQSEYQSASDANRAAIQAGAFARRFWSRTCRSTTSVKQYQWYGKLCSSTSIRTRSTVWSDGWNGKSIRSGITESTWLQSNQMAMNLPMQRIGQAANIFGTTAGQVPGAPVQPFNQGSPYICRHRSLW